MSFDFNKTENADSGRNYSNLLLTFGMELQSLNKSTSTVVLVSNHNTNLQNIISVLF